MSTRRRRHHYVPAFYLRRFANDDERLVGYSRVDGKTIDVVVRDAAVERGLYDVEEGDLEEGDGVETDAAEVVISEIEAKLAPGFDRLVAGSWPPDNETRGLVANFIALQIVRTRENLHSMRALTDTVAKLNYSLLTPETVRQLLIESGDFENPTDRDVAEHLAAIQDFDDYRVEPHPNTLMLDMFGLASSLVQPLADRHWSMQISDEPLYLTTDAPVLAWSEGSMPVGFLTADEVSIPIDPHHSLLMVRDGKGWPEFRIPVPPQLAEQVSHDRAHSSYEWAYCHPDSDILDRIDLPTGARPLGYAGGRPIWRPGKEPVAEDSNS